MTGDLPQTPLSELKTPKFLNAAELRCTVDASNRLELALLICASREKKSETTRLYKEK